MTSTATNGSSEPGASPYVAPAPLYKTAAALRSGRLPLRQYIDELCDRIEAVEPHIQAFVPAEMPPESQTRRARLLLEAAELEARYPDPAGRPPLYGIPVGVKDIFLVDGFPTRAGSALPPEEFTGPEAACVRALRAAGALIVGKTVTAEFAASEPGPARNPHNLEHTPGGSSSGSAAAVAAGMAALALGTQTVGSVIRPASFCGVVGVKPSYGRIPTDGLIFYSRSVDTIGYFTQDVAGAQLAASVLMPDWRGLPDAPATRRPILGIPEGSYLAQASEDGLAALEGQAALLQEKGYTVRRVQALQNISDINHRHHAMATTEFAAEHAILFPKYESLYRSRTANAVRQGRGHGLAEVEHGRQGRLLLRQDLEGQMRREGIDLWVCPAAPGAAPEGIGSTGNPIMNLPWSHSGMPVVALPAGYADNGLPLGLQFIAPFGHDEQLLAWAEGLAQALSPFSE